MLAKLYKLIFDISICYTIGAFLLEFIGSKTISIRGFLILLLTALISILLEQKKRWKPLIMIVLPIGSLIFLRSSVPELIVFLFIWAYYAYVTITERFLINRGVFVDMLKRLAYIYLLPAILILLDIRHLSTHVQAIGPYLASSLVSAVFLLRHLRAANQMEQLKQYRRQQVMELLMFLVICLLLTLVKAPQNLLEGLNLVYQSLLRPILVFFAQSLGMIVMGVIYLVIAVINFLTKKELHYPDTEGVGAPEDSFGFKTSAGFDMEWVRPLLLSIVTIAGLVILFYFFRWLMGERFRQKVPAGIQEIRESIEDMKEKKSNFRKRRPKDSREAVRYYYGKHLLWLKQKKVPLQLQDTTEEIGKKYARALKEEDEVKREASLQLKQLYRKSRYQTAEPITSDEAVKTKQLYQTIKTSKISE